MKKISLWGILISVLMMTGCGKLSSDNERIAVLDMLSEEQLEYLTQEEQLSENEISMMDYESVNWHLLGTGLELYNKSSGVEKSGITYTNTDKVDYVNSEPVSDQKITLDELYEIRGKEEDMRLDDFMGYEYSIKVINADNGTYSMEVPLEEYENTYADIAFKINDDNTVYMQVPVLSYYITENKRYVFSIYYDQANFRAFFENGDYSYNNKLYFGIQYSSVTGHSLVLQIFNNTDKEYSLNDSYEIYRISDGERELLADYSYTTDDITTIKKQSWSIHPVQFTSENALDNGKYVIVFGGDDKDSVGGELEFEVGYKDDESTETASDKTPDEIMDMLWDESELHGYDIFLFPGFTLGFSEENGQYLKTYTHDNLCITAGGINTDSATESDSGKTWIKISNGSIEKEDKIALQIGGKSHEDTSWQERLFLMDLTGDGKDELVIRQQYAEMGLREAYLYVYDTGTLERIEINEDIDSIMNSVITDVSLTDESDGNVEFSITDTKGINYVIEKKISENSQYKWAGLTSCKFIYFEDNQIKCVASAGYTSDDSIGICSVIDIIVTLRYNPDTKCFEPEDDYVIKESDETNDYYFDKVIIDKELEKKAQEALEAWN